MAMTEQDYAQQVQQQINAKRAQIIAYVQAHPFPADRPGSNDNLNRAFAEAAAANGIQLPRNYHIDAHTFQVKHNEDVGATINKIAAGTVGVLTGAAALSPLFGGGAAAGTATGAAQTAGPAVAAAGEATIPAGAAVGGDVGLATGATGAAAGAGSRGAAALREVAKHSDLASQILKTAVPGAAALIGHQVTQGNGAGQITPELRQLLTMAMQRAASQQPLFEAATKQAFMGLPTYARS